MGWRKSGNVNRTDRTHKIYESYESYQSYFMTIFHRIDR